SRPAGPTPRRAGNPAGAAPRRPTRPPARYEVCRPAAWRRASTCGAPAAGASRRPQEARGPRDVARLDPQDRAEAAGARTRRVDGGDVDLGVGQLLHELGDGAGAIVASDQEGALGPGQLPLGLLGGGAEGGGVLGHEVDL